MKIVKKLCFVRVIEEKCFSSTSIIRFARNFEKKMEDEDLDSFDDFPFIRQLRTLRKSFLKSKGRYEFQADKFRGRPIVEGKESTFVQQ